MNQELIAYIKSQLSAGVTDNDIKKVLVANGWAIEDIETAFSNLKKPAEDDENQSFKIPVETGPTTRYDLGIPGEINTDLSNLSESKGQSRAPAVISQKSHGKNLIKAGIVLVVIVIIGSATWVAAKYLTGWISQKAPELNKSLLSPEPPAAITGSEKVVEEGVTNINVLEPTPFASKKGMFEMSVPDSWSIDESGSFGTLASMNNPESDIDGENKFIANINVVSETASGATLEEYLNASKEILNKSFTDYQLVNETRVDLHGTPGILLEAKYNMGVYVLHNMQLMTINKDIAYVITATALDSVWDKYKNIFQSSLSSFILK
jgi:hypothetical protein